MKEVSIQNVTMTMVPQCGVHADLSHLEYPTTGSDSPLIYHSLRDQLEGSLRSATCAYSCWYATKARCNCDDLFGINAGIVRALFEACGKFSPQAVVKVTV